MLLSYEVTSRSDAKNYFAASLSPGGASDRHGYFSEGQESPGVLGGKLAEAWGIDGQTANEAMFHRLCDNLHPVTGRKLKPRNNGFSRIAYDFTVSGPKSFSIVEAFASEEERSSCGRRSTSRWGSWCRITWNPTCSAASAERGQPRHHDRQHAHRRLPARHEPVRRTARCPTRTGTSTC